MRSKKNEIKSHETRALNCYVFLLLLYFISTYIFSSISICTSHGLSWQISLVMYTKQKLKQIMTEVMTFIFDVQKKIWSKAKIKWGHSPSSWSSFGIIVSSFRRVTLPLYYRIIVVSLMRFLEHVSIKQVLRMFFLFTNVTGWMTEKVAKKM